MQTQVTHFPNRSGRETPAAVLVLTREDVQWNRPVFRAPPLQVVPPPIPDFAVSAQESPAGGR